MTKKVLFVQIVRAHIIIGNMTKNAMNARTVAKRQSLRANTVMHGSQLPFRYWFIAIHLLTSTKKNFSVAELQRQFGHKRYEPI